MRTRTLIIIAAIGVLSMLLGGLLYASEAREERQRMHVLALQEEARPYEIELEQAKSDLRTAESRFFNTHETARLVPGAQPGEAGDIALIREVAEEYGIEPVLVLDCAAAGFEELLAASAETGWEIVLTTTPFDRAANERVKAALERLDALGLPRSEVFLLRNDDISDAALAMLAADGFRGFTRYQNAAGSGSTDGGLMWFSYIFYRSIQTNLGIWLSSLIANHGAMLITVEMDALRTGALTREGVDAALDAIGRYVEDGRLQYSGTAEVLEDIMLAGASEEERAAMYDAYVAERQERIDALNGTINDIYARWKAAD